jgi:hypothetical protein
MKEFPSTWTEAFEAAIDGAYFGKQLIEARDQGRIGVVPWAPNEPVNSRSGIWARTGATAIWLHRRVALQHRFIGYYQATGSGMQHFARILADKGYTYGKHYLPHDAEMQQQTDKEYAETRAEILERLGVRPIYVVGRVLDKMDGIEAVRSILPQCWFDEKGCADGLRALSNYQRKWDDKQAVWANAPLHNWASNGTDAYMQFAQHRQMVPMAATKQQKAARSWRTA